MNGELCIKPQAWISTSERFPEDNKEVLVLIRYGGNVKDQLAMMYREEGLWYPVGNRTVFNHGKYITHWLDGLQLP